METIVVNLDFLLPVRQIREPKNIVRFQSILSSIREVGVIEPLMVFPQKNQPGYYQILDGHLRYYALKQLSIIEVECIVSTDDEAFTYNSRISKLSPIQEHRMIMKAVKNQVSPTRIAAALARKESDILAMMDLLKGITPEAVEIIKTKPLSANTVRMFKRVKPIRQIEMAELMVMSNVYTVGYANALLIGTPKDQFISQPKHSKRLTTTQIGKMEQEMESLQRDFKNYEESYGENVLNLTLVKRYLETLLKNGRVVRFLSSHHMDMLTEFEAIIAMESL